MSVSNLHKEYQGLRAVQGVSFVVKPSQVTALIGPNGAGKTTLFSMVAGDVPADGGRVTFQGVEIQGKPPHRICAAGISRTFQNPRLFGELSCLENLLAARYVRTKASILDSIAWLQPARQERQRDTELAQSLLARLGLADKAQLRPAQLSYGNMKRLEIARALATEPRLLLMDEPSAGLAVHVIDDLLRLMRDLTKDGLTILLIEHNMTAVKAIASNVVAMDHGVKIAEGQASAVLSSPAVIEAYLGTS